MYVILYIAMTALLVFAGSSLGPGMRIEFELIALGLTISAALSQITRVLLKGNRDPNLLP